MPSVDLQFAHKSIREIEWSSDITPIDELTLIVINTDINEISRFSLPLTITNVILSSLNIDLSVDNKVFIEIVSDSTPYSSNMLLVPSSLKTPVIITDEGILEQNKRITFLVENVDRRATFANLIIFDNNDASLKEIINIPIPNTSSTKDNVTITKKLDGKYEFKITELTNSHQYRFALYVSTTISYSDIELESNVSNTLGWLEPIKKPNRPFIESVGFDLYAPHNGKFNSYTFILKSPDNSSEYSIKEVIFSILDGNTVVSSDNIWSSLTYADGSPLPSDGILANFSLLKYTTTLDLTPGTEYSYRVIVKNDEDGIINSVSVDSNTLKLTYCSVPAIKDNCDFTITQQNNNTLYAEWRSDIIKYSGSGILNYYVSSSNKTYSSTTKNNFDIPDITFGSNYTFSINGFIKNIIYQANRDADPYTRDLDSTLIGTISDITAYSTTVAKPLHLKASIYENGHFLDSGKIYLNWMMGSNPGVSDVKYKLQYANNSVFSSPTEITNCDTDRTLSNLSSNTAYYFRAQAVVAEFPQTYTYNTTSEAVTTTTESKSSDYVTISNPIKTYESSSITDGAKFTVNPDANNRLSVVVDPELVINRTSGSTTFKQYLNGHYVSSTIDLKPKIDVKYGTMYNYKLTYYINDVIIAVGSDGITDTMDTQETDIGTIHDIIARDSTLQPPTRLKASICDDFEGFLNKAIVTIWTPYANLGFNNITYNLEYSKNPTFSNSTIISGITSTSRRVDVLTVDTFYLRVSASATEIPTLYKYTVGLGETIENSDFTSNYLTLTTCIKSYAEPTLKSDGTFTIKPKSNRMIEASLSSGIVEYASSGNVNTYIEYTSNHDATIGKKVIDQGGSVDIIDVTYGYSYNFTAKYIITDIITSVDTDGNIPRKDNAKKYTIGSIQPVKAYNLTLTAPTTMTTTVLNSNATAPTPNTITFTCSSVVSSNPGVETIKYRVTASTDPTFTNDISEKDSDSNTGIIIDNLINGSRYYTKVETIGYQVTTIYTWYVSNKQVVEYKENILSTPLTLIDSRTKLILTTPFEPISSITGLSIRN